MQKLPATGDPQTARSRIDALERQMLDMPQMPMETSHHFANGMYARAGALKSGCVIVGKVHKTAHFFIVTSGRIVVSDANGVTEMQAGDIMVSQPGTKRAIYAITDAMCMNVHRTDSTDLDEIERELVEPDPLALFDARNNVKPGVKLCS